MGAAPWVIAGLLALLVASSGYAYVEREWRIAAINRAVVAEGQVKARDKALTAAREEATAARARASRYERINRDVASAPDSRACASSPAIRAALDGLRTADRPGVGAGSAGGPAAPAGAAGRPN